MRSACAALLAIGLFVAPAAEARRRSVTPPVAKSEYIDAAKQTANWLMSVAKPVPPDGLSWPISAANSATTTGVDTGAAGIGAFFLRLYEVTNDVQYLDVARRAANFVDARNRSTRISSHDWLAGAAGTGSFLLKMYLATGDARYLDGAKYAADWHIANAVAGASGIYWKFQSTANVYTGLAHGNAGVGLFMLDLFEVTHESKYLDTAKRAYDWLTAYTIPAGDGIVWKRLTTDAETYPGWCGGTSGILFFLYRLSEATHDPEHRAAFDRTLKGLLNTAIAIGDEDAWWFYGPNTSIGVIYCHGVGSVTAAMASAYLVTGDDLDRDVARKAARFVASNAVAEATGISFNHFAGSIYNHYTGLLIGAASGGHVFLRMYRIDPDPRYLDLARSAAAYLIASANHPAPDQNRWINYTSPPSAGDDPPTYETGWYTGAAGIGIFLLELEDATHNRFPTELFSVTYP